MTPRSNRTSLVRNRWPENRVPVGRGFALLDSLFRRPALVVEMDDGTVHPGERGDDEADAGEELSQVMLDLGDDSPRPVPRHGLILKAAIPTSGA